MNTDEHGFNLNITDEGKMLLEEELTETILKICFEVSNELGSGFLESVYKQALLLAFKQAELNIENEPIINVKFRGIIIGSFHADFVIDRKVILEIKAVKLLAPEHEAQLLNYLKASNLRLGLIVNFGKPRLEWKRFIL